MTFEDLSRQLNTSVQSLQNIVQVLSAAFSEMEGGSVEVEPAQSSGYLVGNIKVDGEDNYLYAPPQIIPPHIYDTTERLVAVFYHDNISEDVYEKVIQFTTSNTNEDQSVDVSALNIKEVMSMFAVAHTPSGSVQLNYTVTEGERMNVYFANNNATLKIAHYAAWTNNIPVRIILRYTKNAS